MGTNLPHSSAHVTQSLLQETFAQHQIAYHSGPPPDHYVCIERCVRLTNDDDGSGMRKLYFVTNLSEVLLMHQDHLVSFTVFFKGGIWVCVRDVSREYQPFHITILPYFTYLYK